MDARHVIYRAPEDEIPAEDTARLDGYRHAMEKLGQSARYERELAAAETRDRREASARLGRRPGGAR